MGEAARISTINSLLKITVGESVTDRYHSVKRASRGIALTITYLHC